MKPNSAEARIKHRNGFGVISELVRRRIWNVRICCNWSGCVSCHFVTCFYLFIRIALCNFCPRHAMNASFSYRKTISALLSCSLLRNCGMAENLQQLFNQQFFLVIFVFMKTFVQFFFCFSVWCVFKVLFVLALQISKKKLWSLLTSLLPQNTKKKSREI